MVSKMKSAVERIVDILVEIGKQKDVAKVLRELDEAERSVIATRKIVARKLAKKQVVKPIFEGE